MAQKAFPSFIMAYKNHECKYIFRERDLLRDIGKYATCFGLLKMPKLEELKHKKITDFEDSDFDIRWENSWSNLKFMINQQETGV